MVSIGIRLEDKKFEARVPFTPDQVKKLIQDLNIEVKIQPSKIRTFCDSEYESAGATLTENIWDSKVIFAIKEIPLKFIFPNNVLAFFSHVIKGQSYNMPMLQKILDQKCTLIDYEKIVDEHNRRLIFFGNFAGLAGMIDTLWALGKKFELEGYSTILGQVLPAHKYNSLEEAKSELRILGEKFKEQPLPKEISPIIIGFLGYGNVSKGAQEILNLFPTEEIKPENLKDFLASNNNSLETFYKTVYYEKDLVQTKTKSNKFELQDYYNHPEKYESKFDPSLHTAIINAVYWEKKYPRFVTKNWVKKAYSDSSCPKLKIIGDISCDKEGAIECTVKITSSGDPVFVYDPQSDKGLMGFKGNGPVILAIDNLPCELPKDSSTYFGNKLFPFVDELIKIDPNKSFEDQNIKNEIYNAIVTFNGELTPNFTYLKKFLPK